MSPLATLSPEQRALRKQGLGASEVSAVLGLDPYRTALDVFLDKTDLAEQVDGDNRFTHWGKRLEGVLVEEYEERHPDRLTSPGTTTVGMESWMLATPDRIVQPIASAMSLDARWGLECKCRGFFATDQWGEDGTDEVPHSVAVQCHWGMMVTGLRRWDVVVLLGGNDYREYTLHADDALHAKLYAQAAFFWTEHVQKNVHPPFTGAESDHRFLLRTYPTHTSEMLRATPDVVEQAMLLKIHRDAIKKHEAAASAYEAQIKEFIGATMGVELPFGAITWKHMEPVEVKAHVRKATRRFVPKFDETAPSVAP